jgi:hypothetical protein
MGTRQRRYIYRARDPLLLLLLSLSLSATPAATTVPVLPARHQRQPAAPRARPAATRPPTRLSAPAAAPPPPTSRPHTPSRPRASLRPAHRRPAVHAQLSSGHPRVHHRRRPRPRLGIIFFLDQNLYYYSTITCIYMMFKILHIHFVIRINL